jgi:hypothetical protein
MAYMELDPRFSQDDEEIQYSRKVTVIISVLRSQRKINDKKFLKWVIKMYKNFFFVSVINIFMILKAGVSYQKNFELRLHHARRHEIMK